MNRKHFIQRMGVLGSGFAVLPKKDIFLNTPGDAQNATCKKPPYLKKGDVIGITSPAGSITVAEIQPAVAVMESWGYQCKVGATIGKKDFTYGGTDEERRTDLQQMLDDPSIAAIMCARGGYGSVRIVDGLKWS